MFLQNKTFVFRGRGFESRADFVSRILDQFPHAEQKTKLEPPSEEEKESIKQLLQINKVETVMELKPKFYHEKTGEERNISPKIKSYYEHNEVCKFTESRMYSKGPKDKENEFKNLWVERTVYETRDKLPGMLQWSPVIDPPKIEHLNPLDNAIETVEKANNDLRTLILGYMNPTKEPNFGDLSRKLGGIIGKSILEQSKVHYAPETFKM